MILDEINVSYFKGIQELDIKFDKKISIIYGENGSGKSSIFEAMHLMFYFDKIKYIEIIGKTKVNFDEEVAKRYKNRNHKDKSVKITIKSDGKEAMCEDFKIHNGSLLDQYSFFFANERILNELSKENFYIVIKDTLSFYFDNLAKLANNGGNISALYKEFEDENYYDKLAKEKNIDKEDIKFRNLINDILENNRKKLEKILNENMPLDDINKIIKNNFKENFEVSIKLADNSAILEDKSELNFLPPEIELKINNVDHEGKLYQNFNEAKLKLMSLAIYFTLVKNQSKNSKQKLLVLDDFLTSLDMGNRKVIIEYILDEFKDFQIIIFTHNIHFFNLIQDITKENKDISFQRLFNFNDEINIYKSNPGFLKQACEELRKGNLEISAHLCRKEFERICHEFEELLQIGKKEELQTIIDLIKNEELVLPEEKLVEKIEELQKASKPEKDKLDILKNVVTKKLGLKKEIQCLIKKCENYKKILLNPSSHYDIQREFHQKECQESTQLIECLKELKIKLCDFKKSENIKEIQKICKDM